ncbi:membrane protein insertase YidC [Agaribacter marinus]|uniref:Membrane protein insertase YidC n=1 Tax=Agaribacter marinus TaxID=1431249 RepID=A0AA37WKB3_9ALTE|nr:membrane protein insertase YidC [Agaribacter marinus]GLR71269.1 membrane protein insertase YidC [Agaribacter marinus]
MESQRSILIIGLLLVSFLLWIEYQEAYGPQPIESAEEIQQQNTQNTESSDGFVPQADTSALPQSLNTAETNAQRFVDVTTDTLHLTIDTIGGDVIATDLIKYPVTQGGDDAYQILTSEPATLYIAQSGLIGNQGTDLQSGRAQYSVPQGTYALDNDKEQLIVPLSVVTKDGIQVTKSFTFTRGSHAIDVSYIVNNTTSQVAQVQQYSQLKQTLTERSEGSMFMPTYRGAAYSTLEDKYEKYTFSDIQDERLNIATQGGWVGMLEHYFVSAWVPPQNETNSIYSALSNNAAIIGYKGQTVNIPAGETTTLSSILYIGPKDQGVLANIARGLDLTADYGILWWISQPLFALLKWIYGIVGNWGFAIIFTTIIVKGAMYWLTKKQYESMAKMRALQPKLQQLKDRFGDDKQKMSKGMMELYKKEKVNPMGGCFPMLLQMPIFMALYWVLLESVELRHAEFGLWISDLSVRDPWFVLPILTGASMFLLQRLQPMTIQDPMQQKIFQYMPVAMSIFFFFFPAGLVLYWLMSNIITLVQAKIIYASMEKRGLKTK